MVSLIGESGPAFCVVPLSPVYVPEKTTFSSKFGDEALPSTPFVFWSISSPVTTTWKDVELPGDGPVPT